MSIKEIIEKVKSVRGSRANSHENGSYDYFPIDKPSSKLGTVYFLVLLFILGIIVFGLGRLSVQNKTQTPISVAYNSANTVFATTSQEATLSSTTQVAVSIKSATTSTEKTTTILPAPNTSTQVIGSKSGKKYYFPWCGTVKRIKPENQVHFDTIEKAKEAGFAPGGNCKGLY